MNVDLPIGLTPERVRARLADGGRSLFEAQPKRVHAPMVASLPDWFIAEPEQVMACPVVMVTPDIAKQWLTRNDRNRIPSQAKIEQFAAMMRDGEWDGYNAEAIKFSWSGRLLDGQSRLNAVVLSGVTVRMMVVLGIPDEAQSTMDTGEVRSLAHHLQMAGYKDCNNIASAARLLWSYLHKGFNIRSLGKRRDSVGYLTHRQAIELLQNLHPGIVDAVHRISSHGASKQVLSVAPLAVLYYLFANVDKDLANEMIETIRTGEPTYRTKPVIALREKILMAKLEGNPLEATTRMILTVKAWNVMRCVDTMPLVHRKGDSFPAIDGCWLAKSMAKEVQS